MKVVLNSHETFLRFIWRFKVSRLLLLNFLQRPVTVWKTFILLFWKKWLNIRRIPRVQRNATVSTKLFELINKNTDQGVTLLVMAEGRKTYSGGNIPKTGPCSATVTSFYHGKSSVETCSGKSAAHRWLPCTAVTQVFFPLANPVARPLFFHFCSSFVQFYCFYKAADDHSLFPFFFSYGRLNSGLHSTFN